MLNQKKLLKMARKWKKMASLGRRRIASTRTNGGGDQSQSCSSSLVASRGHIFVYTTDGKRFMIPLPFLTSNIFRKLFRMSEDEFGLPSNGPITLPCDASSMEYIISLHKSKVSVDVERAVLTSIIRSRCVASSLPALGHDQQHLLLYGF